MTRTPFFLIILIFISLNQNLKVAFADNEILYVDGYVSIQEDFNELGSSPWLDNDISNEIYSKTDKDKHEYFTFEDPTGSGMINRVNIWIEAKGPSARNDKIAGFLWNGISWSPIGFLIDPDDDDYKFYDTGEWPFLSNWEMITKARLKIEYDKSGSPKTQDIYVRRVH